MKSIATKIPELRLTGITVRTNNSDEMNPSLAKIGLTLQKYFQEGLPDKIVHRKNPGVTYCVYTDYESDHTGDYTYFIGEEVDSFINTPEKFHQLTIPEQTYEKFTCGPGIMPEVCITAWQKIWTMAPSALLGKRTYIADFEVYDERALDPQNTTLDIYIGIDK